MCLSRWHGEIHFRGNLSSSLIRNCSWLVSWQLSMHLGSIYNMNCIRINWKALFLYLQIAAVGTTRVPNYLETFLFRETDAISRIHLLKLLTDFLQFVDLSRNTHSPRLSLCLYQTLKLMFLRRWICARAYDCGCSLENSKRTGGLFWHRAHSRTWFTQWNISSKASYVQREVALPPPRRILSVILIGLPQCIAQSITQKRRKWTHQWALHGWDPKIVSLEVVSAFHQEQNL